MGVSTILKGINGKRVDMRHIAFVILEACEREPLDIGSGHTAIEVKSPNYLLCGPPQNSWNGSKQKLCPSTRNSRYRLSPANSIVTEPVRCSSYVTGIPARSCCPQRSLCQACGLPRANGLTSTCLWIAAQSGIWHVMRERMWAYCSPEGSGLLCCSTVQQGYLFPSSSSGIRRSDRSALFCESLLNKKAVLSFETSEINNPFV